RSSHARPCLASVRSSPSCCWPSPRSSGHSPTATSSLSWTSHATSSRSRTELLAENALLRQQLIALRRQVRRPKFTHADRWWRVLAARLTQRWRDVLMLVQPATLLRWHRALHRRWWAWKSRPRATTRPSIVAETTALIRQ